MTISSPRAAPARWCTNPSSPAMVFSVLGSLITTISAPCWLPALPDQRPTSRMSRSASSGSAVFLNSRTARRLRRKSVRLCAVSVSAILLPRVVLSELVCHARHGPSTDRPAVMLAAPWGGPSLPDVSFGDLLLVTAVAFAAPFTLGLFPALRLPAVVVEILAGIVLGPSLMGWLRVDLPVQILSLIGLAFLLFLAGMEISF